jgi:hypothetical protein
METSTQGIQEEHQQGGSNLILQTDDEQAQRRLWASVIIQALIDATAEPKTVQAKIYKAQAQAWLTVEVGTTAQNFEEVCLAAEIAPDRVRTFIRNYNGPPLTLHVLSRMRNEILKGPNANNHRPDPDA